MSGRFAPLRAPALRAAGLSMLLLIPVPAQSEGVEVRHDLDVSNQRPEMFSVCHGHGCREVVRVSLTETQWGEVRNQFSPPVTNGTQERRRIRQAIALLEVLIGQYTGTSADIAGTFAGTGRTGQMDCVDEATNTTAYLQMMSDAGLISWHTVEQRAHRDFFILGWPHTTAVIRDTETGERFAVDSWFHANGVPPEIVPLRRWRTGWRPDK